MISKIKKVLKKTVLVASLSMVGFLGVAPPANAFYEAAFYAWFGSEWTPFLEQYTSFVTEVDDQFFAINEYLAEIYQYMATDTGNTQGMGIIGAINGNMNKIWSEARPYMESTGEQGASWNRKTALDAIPGQTIMNRMPDPRNCSELPARMAGRGARGGGGGSHAGKGKIESMAAEAATGTHLSDTEYAADIYSNHGAADANLCTKQDVNYSGDAAVAFGTSRKGYGCTAVGTMPDGDARAQSILVPAHDYDKVAAGDAAEIAKASSLTYSPTQAKVAAMATRNLAQGFSAPALSPEAEKSPAGKLLLAKEKILQMRISPAVQALASIAGSRTPAALGSNAATALSANWKSTAGPIYSRVFPAGTVVPDVPSTAELTRFEVYRRMFDIGGGADSWVGKLMESNDPAQVAQIQAETQAVQLYVEYEILGKLEENNAMQAAILAQLVNPVSKQEITAATNSVFRSK